MKRAWIFDGIGIVVLACWVAVMGALFADDFGITSIEHIELSPQDVEAGFRAGEEWQGIYLRDQKVGYLRLRKRKLADGYEMRSRMVLHLTVMRRRQKIVTDSLGTLDRDFVLRDFAVKIDSGVSKMAVRGTVTGTKVHLEMETGGSVQRREITLAEPPRMLPSVKAFVLRQQLVVGDAHRLSFFDPMTLVEREVVITYRGLESLRVMGQEVEAHHLTQSIGDVEYDVWTNAIGEVLQEHLPMGLTGIREGAAEARYGVSTGDARLAEDLVDAVAVTPAGPPIRPHAPTLVLTLSGLDFEGLHLDGGRQRWEPDPHDTERGILRLRLEAIGARRRTTVADLRGLVSERGSETVRAALEPGMMIQSAEPAIVAQARKIVGEGRGLDVLPALDVARKVSTWVFTNLKKESVIGLPSAIETLRTMTGDCNEHATLATALLRALGLPARMAAGIVYLPDRGRFFYHAWVEVWVDGWIAFDPTYDQFPADVGHVRFIAGNSRDQMEMFRVIGNLEIQHSEEQP